MWAVWHHFCLELICQNCFAHSVLVLIVLSMMLLNSFLYCVFVNRYFYNPVCIYSFKVNNRNTGEMYVICSKLTIKTPGGNKNTRGNKDTRSSYWCRFGALTIIFNHVSHLFVVLLLWNLRMYLFAENCPSKRVLILILKGSVIIYIRHIIYTVFEIKSKHWIDSSFQ